MPKKLVSFERKELIFLSDSVFKYDLNFLTFEPCYFRNAKT
jgi:hypothetical protein